MLVKKPTHEGLGQWTPKARIVCCGNFEAGTVGHDLKNRAEVPGSVEFRTLLAVAAKREYSIGSLDVKNAFLHAPLDPEEDGFVIVTPPQVLVRLGLAEQDEVWILHKAMYGLRCAPKRWSDFRDNCIRKFECKTSGNRKITFEECPTTRSVWKIVETCQDGGKRVEGLFMVYVDDVVIFGMTETIQMVFDKLLEKWKCKITGILVRDNVLVEMLWRPLPSWA